MKVELVDILIRMLYLIGSLDPHYQETVGTCTCSRCEDYRELKKKIRELVGQ